jgi:MoxR-like ATPase
MESLNYFNYYTEIEEYFWRKRGAHLLVSPLDWAIVETWQKAGIPLTAVLKGIDRAFESWNRSRRAAGGRQLKSLVYCVDAVLDAAAEAQEAAAGTGPQPGPSRRPAAEPFSREELSKYLTRNADRLRHAAERQRASRPAFAARLGETASRLEQMLALLDPAAALDLEDLERRLTVLEEKLTAAMSAEAEEDDMLAIRREMDRSLAPYRRKMSAEQLAQLERQYTQKRLYEHFEVPRLSLFYLI